MVSSTALVVSAASIFFSLPVNAGLYTKNSPVLQLNAKTYDRLVAKSNGTSIVEFYAPWCGHCQNLKPAYEKAAKNLAGLAQVAAVDCDDEANKPFCGTMGIKGFPTLKIVRPGKKSGRPVVEDYQGARAAKAIVDAVVDKIPNHVKKVTDTGLNEWLKEEKEAPKAILFSDKGTTSALLRALAIDYLGSVSFAQVRDKEKNTVSTFGITKFPTLVVLPGGEKEKIVYDGEMKKDAITSFITEASGVSPNSEIPAAEPKKKAAKAKESTKSKDSKKSTKDDGECPMGRDKKGDSASMKIKDSSFSTEDATDSTDAKADVPPPVKVDNGPPMIQMLEKDTDLQRLCLSPKSKTCVLALLPTKADKNALLPKEATQALISLGEVQHKHSRRHSLFPFYSVPAENVLGRKVRETLGLKKADEIEVIAVNAKRSWYRKFSGTSFKHDNIEAWVDTIRMNEGTRETLPDSLIAEVEAAAEPEPAKAAEPSNEEQEPILVEDLGEVEDDAPPEPEVPVHGEL